VKVQRYRRLELLLGLGALVLLASLISGPAYCGEQTGYVYDGVNRVDLSTQVTNSSFTVTAPFSLMGSCEYWVACNQSGGSYSASGRVGLDWNGAEAGSDPWTSPPVPHGYAYHATFDPTVTITGPTGARIGAAWIDTTAGSGLGIVDSHLFQVS
jgi:hypothetical protein